ncbi:hypothetical protein PybrP1_011532 [[Pythium] brassicae (nom. inval.)]|nr:hypothetical protein PybrP1_011532 [[Pythium] brassicae (nom. inval.)]
MLCSTAVAPTTPAALCPVLSPNAVCSRQKRPFHSPNAPSTVIRSWEFLATVESFEVVWPLDRNQASANSADDNKKSTLALERLLNIPPFDRALRQRDDVRQSLQQRGCYSRHGCDHESLAHPDRTRHSPVATARRKEGQCCRDLHVEAVVTDLMVAEVQSPRLECGAQRDECGPAAPRRSNRSCVTVRTGPSRGARRQRQQHGMQRLSRHMLIESPSGELLLNSWTLRMKKQASRCVRVQACVCDVRIARANTSLRSAIHARVCTGERESRAAACCEAALLLLVLGSVKEEEKASEPLCVSARATVDERVCVASAQARTNTRSRVLRDSEPSARPGVEGSLTARDLLFVLVPLTVLSPTKLRRQLRRSYTPPSYRREEARRGALLPRTLWQLPIVRRSNGNDQGTRRWCCGESHRSAGPPASCCRSPPPNRLQWQAIEDEFAQLRGIQDAVGAVDGSLITIERPADYEGFYCRKGNATINVQVVVSARQHLCSLTCIQSSRLQRCFTTCSKISVTTEFWWWSDAVSKSDAGRSERSEYESEVIRQIAKAKRSAIMMS